MKTRNYRDLKVWQKGMLITKLVYELTGQFPKAEIFGLTAQMRRAAVPVPSNIAEGHGKTSAKQFALALGHARGSLYELETQAQVASDIGYIDAEVAGNLVERCGELARMINALLKTVKGKAND